MGDSTPTAETPGLSTTFPDAFRWILRAEGGSKLVNDTGGITRYGISQRAHPDVDVEHITEAQAKQIYFESYWRPIKGSALPASLALVVFDAAVNMGVPAAVKILQTVLRSVAVDGVMGPETISAAKLYHPRDELVAQFMRLRNAWYRDVAGKNPEKYAKYLYGWEMRCWRLALEAGRC